MKELVFGHKNTDTDAICAAKAYSYLQNQRGFETEAVALGEPNEETKFVLDYFKEPAPRVIEKASDEVEAVMLVDHNEPQQSVDDIKDLTVTHVVDHHRIANFDTAAPLYYHAEPLGCCSTIVYKEYKASGVEVPEKIAGLMLSSIISDTLLFKSPTTTDEDKQAVEELAQIAGVDYEKYGLEMLKAGTNLASKTEEELITADAKSFEMGGKTVRVDQVNTVDLDEVFARESALRAAIPRSCEFLGGGGLLMDNGKLRYASEEFLAIQDPSGILSHSCLRPVVYSDSDATGHGRAGVDTERKEKEDKEV